MNTVSSKDQRNPNRFRKTGALSKHHQQNEFLQNQPSLRHSAMEDFDEVEVPLEFQTVVTKHLDQILEESLNKKSTEDAVPVKRKRKKSRIQLFSDSKHSLEVFDENLHNISVKNHNKRRIDDVSSDNDLEMLKSVVVEPEYVMSGIEVSVWAKRNRKTNFRYKRQPNGVLTYIDTTS